MPQYTTSQRLALFLVPRLASLFIRILGSTLRYEDVIAPGVTPGSQIPGPVVYAFWHRCLLSCAYYFRGQKIAILISRSFDGELIARTVERLGFIAIRGSSSRGGAAALRQIADEYGRGTRCAITADGPRGPNMVAKPGTAQLAQLVGAWVGTFYVLPPPRLGAQNLGPLPHPQTLQPRPHHLATPRSRRSGHRTNRPAKPRRRRRYGLITSISSCRHSERSEESSEITHHHDLSNLSSTDVVFRFHLASAYEPILGQY